MLDLIQKHADDYQAMQQDMEMIQRQMTECLDQLSQFDCPSTRQELEYLETEKIELSEIIQHQNVILHQLLNYVNTYSERQNEFDCVLAKAGFDVGEYPYTCLLNDGATKDEIDQAVANLENLGWTRAWRAGSYITECSPQTIDRYIRRVLNIAKKYNLKAFVERLIEKTDQNRATFRWTRAALNFFFEMFMVCGRASDELYKLHKKLNDVEVNKLSTENQKQTYTRLKSVKDETLPVFIGTLETFGDIGLSAALMFRSTIYLGLRPTEWEKAYFLPEDPRVLAVKNAKASNGRACGEYRFLDLSDFEDDTYSLIRKTVNLVQRSRVTKNGFNNLLNRVRRAIRKTHQKLFRKTKKGRICLYTARHQFSANMKRLLGPFQRGLVAALMGHNVDRTSSFHYAHANQALRSERFGPQADGTNAPMPDPQNVALVRITNSHLKAMELGANTQCSQSSASSTSESTAYSSYSMSM